MPSAMPLREGLHYSITQLKAYLRCPRQYELRYVRGVAPEFVPVPLAFGVAIHHALAVFFGAVKLFGAPPDQEEVDQAFRDEWERFATGPTPIRSGGDEESDDEGKHVEKGIEMLAVFREHVSRQPLPDVHAVELPFTIDVHAPDTGEVLDEKLTGTIDLVLVEEGRKVIVEHKSSSKRYSADQIKHDPQLTAYQIAAREIGLGEPGLRFNIITKTKKPAIQVEDVRRDERDEDDFARLSVGVLRAIDAGAFYPVRSWACASCPFQRACSSRARTGCP